MSSSDIDYEWVKIHFFPEKLDEDEYSDVDENGKIDYDAVLFKSNGYLIEAGLWKCNIPPIIWEDPIAKPIIQSKIVDPVKNQIVEELKTVEDILPEIYNLSVKGLHGTFVLYEKKLWTSEPDYNVYGRMEGRIEKHRANKRFHIFEQFAEKLTGFSNPEDLLKPEHIELLHVAQAVYQEDDKTPYVKSKSLREALKGVLTIYEKAEELEKLF